MSAPSKAQINQRVKILPTQRLAASVERTSTGRTVMDYLKLLGRRYQAATQVNVLSPEILLITKADGFHIHGRQYCNARNSESITASSGSEAVA